MTVTSVEQNTEDLTLTLTADFDAPVERVWELWADPRQLERWWGPPAYPATMQEHDLSLGGDVKYFMTGPEGEKHHGWWKVTAVEPPRSLEFDDGFADEQGKPNPEMPVTKSRVQLSDHEGGTRMQMRATFESLEQMEKLAEMGMVEGLREAAGQMDAVLAG